MGLFSCQAGPEQRESKICCPQLVDCRLGICVLQGFVVAKNHGALWKFEIDIRKMKKIRCVALAFPPCLVMLWSKRVFGMKNVQF